MTALPSRLDESVLHETSLTPATKQYIIHHLWGCDSRYQRHLDLSSYWSFYINQCRLALHENGTHISVRTHRDILEVTTLLKRNCSRQEIRDAIRAKLSNTAPADQAGILDRSIDLAASLLLMIDFGGPPYGFSGQTQLPWNNASLQDFVGEYFKQPPILGHEQVKLERIFNAQNLERIAGVKIIWTNNLADHLRLIDGDLKVGIFHHASFLEAHCKISVLPLDFVDETLQTLALLFPSDRVLDKDLHKWFWNKQLTLNLDRRIIQCGRLKTEDRQIERFFYWHDRLVILKQVFDEATPKTLPQWWHDRRNGVQWYTFWVALLVLSLTILFGLIQCIEGAWQVRLAYVALSSNGSQGAP